MRNLDIADTRAKLELYASLGTLAVGDSELVGELRPGGDAAITTDPDAESDENEALDRAALDTGVD
jgi:argininosuccinate synthase